MMPDGIYTLMYCTTNPQWFLYQFDRSAVVAPTLTAVALRAFQTRVIVLHSADPTPFILIDTFRNPTKNYHRIYYIVEY